MLCEFGLTPVPIRVAGECRASICELCLWIFFREDRQAVRQCKRPKTSALSDCTGLTATPHRFLHKRGALYSIITTFPFKINSISYGLDLFLISVEHQTNGDHSRNDLGDRESEPFYPRVPEIVIYKPREHPRHGKNKQKLSAKRNDK